MTERVRAIVTRQKRENDRFGQELDRRLREARGFLASIPAALLKLDPALRRIVLFGSLAAGTARHTGFDIDLAVDSDRYLRIVDWSLSQAWPIDVVDLSAIDEGFAEQIARHGRILYEANRR